MSPLSSSLPPSVYNPRRHVGIHAERISDVSSTEYPGHYPGEDHSWSLEVFRKVYGLKPHGTVYGRLIGWPGAEFTGEGP